MNATGNNNKRLKNQASQRLVPLHDRLREVGFMQFVDKRRASGDHRLFPGQSYCPKNGYGRNAGRWFNARLLSALGMKANGLVFHSLRHTMATILSRNDVSETQVKAILGHEQPGVTYSTYLHGFRPSQLQAAINRFGF